MQQIFFTTIIKIIKESIMEQIEKEEIQRYTDSLYYELEQTTKFFRVFSLKFFKKLNVNLSPDEYVTIETILCNAGICQRDLAKLILKDRANTGKILDSLEEKG